ncbi:MAG: hypothetical protein NC390_08495 [Fusobacterium sp.]|nr:hypothetical protein [Fusobacterium sp.]
MNNDKKENTFSKWNFSFGNTSKSEMSGATAVLERDTFESSSTDSTVNSEIKNDFSKNSSDKNMKHITNIINGLAMHEDMESISVLNEIGTNSSVDSIREMTARALVRKNMAESLHIVIMHEGKGINDLSTSVAMSTINELLSLQNKEIAMQVLEEAVANSEIEMVRDNARSVKALMALC